MAEQTTRGAILTVDLAAVAQNYRRLASENAPSELAAVVKADAYGLGVEPVAATLWATGCKTYFVATLEEGIALRGSLPEAGIHVFNGAPVGTEADAVQHRLVPVLNSIDDVARWREYGISAGSPVTVDLHIDTGMARLGVSLDEVDSLPPPNLGNNDGLALDVVLSHLACSDEPDNPMNKRQLADLSTAYAKIGGERASLAASSGIFLGSSYHLDMGRAGVALYGVNPIPGTENPMEPVVKLQARILQIRKIGKGASVGYGATRIVDAPTKVATLAIGYADGYLRSASDTAIAYIGDIPAPVLGRISMDLTTVDVSGVPDDMAVPGSWVDMIGANNSIDDFAAAAGTIGYEVLTRLGPRLYRTYVGC